MLVFLVLLFLYAGLTLAYVLSSRDPPLDVPPWPELTVPTSVASASGKPCTQTSDCPPHHVCLGRLCVPKLLRGGRCDPLTGEWRAQRIRDAFLAVCICKDPDLFTQRLFGGNCDVSVACGLHGTYDPAKGTCICEPGYRASGLECVRVPAVQLPCDPDELEVSAIDPFTEGFHPDYVVDRLQSHARCTRRPCSFDAFTGRRLEHGKHEPGWGCVCDPSRGLFGVVLEVPGKKYLNAPGFDACASIYVRDDLRPARAEHATYFYLGHRAPVSVVSFDASDQEAFLVPVLRGRGGRFALRQSPWRNDFAQHFLWNRADYRVRVRRARKLHVWNIYDFEDGFEEKFRPTLCAYLVPRTLEMGEIYRVMYENPVCEIRDGEPTADREFWGRIVLNPNFFTVDDGGKDLPRHNAMVLRFEGGVWTLAADRPYRVEQFRQHPNNAPVY